MVGSLADVMRDVQEQQRPWVKWNFGDRPAEQPLLGIIEEFGELAATNYVIGDCAAERADAIADAMIFICDYASAMGLDAGAFVESMDEIDGPYSIDDAMVELLHQLGRLSHAHLKKRQGIRSTENHDEVIPAVLGQLVAIGSRLMIDSGWNPADIVWSTWVVVRQRDWKSNPDGAHKG